MATAFLSPAVMNRPNLYVACGAHVSRVLYDRLDSTLTPAAIGVEFQTKKGSERYEVHAKREVILAGGSINTPQTLMLSGIGPADELKKHGISIVKENNAVGQNLKDHLCPSGVICKAKTSATLDYLENTVKAIPSLLRWFVTGKGPLTSNAGEAAAFIRTVDHKFDSGSEENKPKDYGSGGVGPDVEIIGAPLAFIHHGEEPALPGSGVFSIASVGLRPQSKGTITLKSADPFEHRKWSGPSPSIYIYIYNLPLFFSAF
jgi:choline dehydrogenase